MTDYKNLIRESFNAVVEDLNYDQAMIDRYFSPNYRQYVDGKELDYEGFCRHMKFRSSHLKAFR